MSGLGDFGRNALGDNYAFLSLDLRYKDITALNGIQKYQYLQKLNISNNHLTSLKALRALPYITDIDASKNMLENLQYDGT